MRASRPTTLATHGMIATPHYLATSAGLQVLEEGGSAMDAVICANAMLTVLYPDQTALGGDCFFMAFDAATGTTHGYNGSGPAPAAADPAALRADGWTAMPNKGPYAITVPGTIDAWFAGHERFGRLEMSRLLEPATTLARDGFPVSPRLTLVLAGQRELIASWPGLQSLVHPGGSIPGEGSLLRMPSLARSFETIRAEGRDAFYTGEIAAAIAATVGNLGGWLSREDLAAHTGEWVEPVSVEYRDVTVSTMPPNSQGLTALLGLRMAELEPAPTAWGSAAHLHPFVEAAKRAYRVRDAEITDPAFADIDVDDLLSDDSIERLWSDYDPEWVTQGQPSRAGDTVYLCAVDADGNAVSLIQSLFGAFGSCVVAENTGILLQNRGASFSLNPERINLLEGGKRTRHTLMPSMLFDGERLLGPFGTQGGDPQAQIQMQLISNVVDFGMDPQAAIEAHRWIAGSDADDDLLMEAGFPEGTVQRLAARGHRITLIDPWNPGAGHAQMILVDWQSGVLKGGADPRADGAAAGY
ncbi:MAG: gamma-glutamyltransferase [Chloroflexia bacterium]|nr:gamma-glutamyltransferase [Chloroflexia bacterium]